MKPPFKKGQKVVCIHYKDKPILKVYDVVVKTLLNDGYNGAEIWVKETPSRKGVSLWWGPADWFQVVNK